MAARLRVVPILLAMQALKMLRCGGCSEAAEGGFKLPQKWWLAAAPAWAWTTLAVLNAEVWYWLLATPLWNTA